MPKVEETPKVETKVEEKEMPAPAPAPATPATGEASELASVLREAISGSKNFQIAVDENVKSRFSLVKDNETGEIMLRDNDEGTLSEIQMKSLEEKKADLLAREYEEL
jgi:hypothetical protein